MNRSAFATSLATLALVSLARATAKEHHMSFPAMQSLIDERGQVHEVKIFHISQTITTRTTILPEKLEAFPGVEKHVVTDAVTIDALFAHLRASEPAAATQMVEYRWKLVFERHDGASPAVMYLSGIAPSGMLGDHPFAVKNLDFANWLREKFSPEDEAFFKKYGS